MTIRLGSGLLLATLGARLVAQPTPPQLPRPTGPYAVGRTSMHWIDSSRTEPFVPALSSRREVMVYVWYPADSDRPRRAAPYIPHAQAINGALGDSAMRLEFDGVLGAVLSGSVDGWASEGAPLSHARARFPVLIFSHGIGESSLTYAAQLTDLASHGYIVFAVEHPYDAYAVWFPDGRVIPYAQAASDSAEALPNGRVAYQLAQIPVRVADMRFVLDRVIRLGAAPENPFTHRLDLGRVGAFGHSLGGVAAAGACREDARIRACANEDADDDGRPFAGGPAAQPIKQPFLFFASGHSIYVSARTPPPTEDALAHMKLSRAQYDSIVQLYQHNQDASLARMPGGAERVMAESNTFTHGTFIDLKMLRAHGAAADEQRHYMELIRAYVRAFFDETLGNGGERVTANLPMDSIITVQRFGALSNSAARPPR